MNTPKEYYILTFKTTTDVMQAEKYLKPYFDIAIMPVPREISSGCGLAIRFQKPNENEIIRFLQDSNTSGILYKMETKKVDGKHPTKKVWPL